MYRYVSAAASDGRTQCANMAAFPCYGIVPRMMVSPPERDLSIQLFGKDLVSPMFMAPIGLVGWCAPDFRGDVAARPRPPSSRAGCAAETTASLMRTSYAGA